MKKTLLILVLSQFIMSCGNGKSNEKILLDATGTLNNISVVVDNQTWKGPVGETVRDILAAPIYGLPQDEPIFEINQIPPHVFTDFITKNRTVLIVQTNKETGISFRDNVYAKPQKVITVTGQTKQDAIQVLHDNAAKITETFKGIELEQKQQLIKKSLYDTRVLKKNLGVDLNFPTAYRIGKTIATDADKFYWIKRDIPTGYVNVLLYELPLHAIKKDTNMVAQIVKIRDSIGKKYIEGPVEGSYMITENAYTPFHTQTIIDNKPTLETKGLWEVQNAFMAGPYVNYAIEDQINKRWIVIEGFTYAPSISKRSYMFELEAIIKSIKIQ